MRIAGSRVLLSGAQYVTITGFAVAGNQEAVLAQSSQDIVLDRLTSVGVLQKADVRVDGSSNVTVSRSSLANGIELDSGADDTVITTNQITSGPYDGSGFAPAIRAVDAAATTIESNTITPACEQGIELEGTSTNALIANNIIDTAGNATRACGSAGSAPITVASTAVSGTASDYNLAFTTGVQLYSWDGTGYSGLASFTAATGQGVHDLVADPQLVVPDTFPRLNSSVPYYPSEGSPEVDSGDAAHAPPTDLADQSRVDDPLVANSGAGSGYIDRGAFSIRTRSPSPRRPPSMSPVPALWTRPSPPACREPGRTRSRIHTSSTTAHLPPQRVPVPQIL